MLTSDIPRVLVVTDSKFKLVNDIMSCIGFSIENTRHVSGESRQWPVIYEQSSCVGQLEV